MQYLLIIVVVIIVIISLNVIYVYALSSEAESRSENLNSSKLNVIASFYPLYEFTKKIGGEKIELSTAIPFGIEPHDWEPTPQDISKLNTADIIIYNSKGFDSWLNQFKQSKLIDVSAELELIKSNEPKGDFDKADNYNLIYDPHIWLDPILVKNISQTIGNNLIKIDPNNTNYYQQNTDSFIKELDLLDQQIRKSLINCELKDFISFHEAFHYFANRYGLTQHSVYESLSSEGEILPQQIIKIISLAKSLDIDTIYSEELKNQRLAQTFASEIPNGKVLLLSPIENINKEEQEKNIGYIDKMKKNIENLEKGLRCK
ncbi:MAG TPA: zinc ABC transporter substrate-binding protein [Nitrososphaeraceae archaeon]|nr:zinc ABC transporter substrate-binding protein [Nitrososphaeraceae archaeon]